MLAKLHLQHAAAVAICIDDSQATREVLITVRRLAPTLPIIARARDNEHALSLLTLGATRVVPEVLEAGLQLGHLLLEEVGMPVNVARDLVEALRVESEVALSSRVGSI